MALNLYRRHRKQCEGGHPEDARSGEFEERRKGWKKCACTIHVSGTLNGKFRRKDTCRNAWEDARAFAAELERAGSWNRNAPAPAPNPEQQKPEAATAFTVRDALNAYLANRAGRHIAPSTLRKYKTLAKQLPEFAEHKGFTALVQIATTDMDEFYALWKDGVRSKGKKLERLKGFFEFCENRKWIPESPPNNSKRLWAQEVQQTASLSLTPN